MVILLVTGCASSREQAGDFTPPFLAQLKSCGARIPTVADLPVISTTWSIAPDSAGFVARLPPERFQDVDALLRLLYGSPTSWDDRDLDGQPHGNYGPQQAGVVIQYVRTPDHTVIVCLKPRRNGMRTQTTASHGAGAERPQTTSSQGE